MGFTDDGSLARPDDPQAAARQRRYTQSIDRIAGSDVAKATINSPSYPALQSHIGQLRNDGLDERRMLEQALRNKKHDLPEVADPAAVLRKGLDEVPRIPSWSVSRSRTLSTNELPPDKGFDQGY